MKKLYLIIFFLSLFHLGNAQGIQLSEKAEISILTIGAGDNLNDSFGHSGFRIKDTNLNIDIVFNYGTYNFNTPNFYLKFARGKLLYKIDSNNFKPFYNYYVKQNRSIIEQQLNLTKSEKQELFNYLLNNSKPENQEYLYDFLFDNCATRIRDVLVTILGDKLNYKEEPLDEKSYTFRELIQKNVYWNSWGSFGMDIAIGAVVDQKATVWQYQFLPHYVMEAANNTSVTNEGVTEKLVKSTSPIYEEKPYQLKSIFFTSPLFVMGLLGLLILYITYNDFKNNKRSRYLDAFIFLITGLIGIFLLLLWMATDHSTTKNNYDLLWAFPFSLLFIASILKKNPPLWLGKYIFFLLLMLVLLCVHWLTGVQEFALALTPLLVALFIRYIFLIRYFKRISKS
ncbi:MAG: DUF4105 domain-containing protein [Flavobacteriaceae bacterium]